MPIQEKPRIDNNSDKPRIDEDDVAIYKKQCGKNSNGLLVRHIEDITYIDHDVTGDGIKEKLARITQHSWRCGVGYLKTPPRFDIAQYGTPKDTTKGVVKNSKGDSFTINDVALIGTERYYIIAIPGQSFEDIPTPDEIKLVLIPEKTLDNIRQTSKDTLPLQEKLAALQEQYEKDKSAVDEKEAQEVSAQLAKHVEKNLELLATTVVAKRAGDIEKAGDLPLPKEDKAAFMGMIETLHQKESKMFLLKLINIALSNLANEEVAAD